MTMMSDETGDKPTTPEDAAEAKSQEATSQEARGGARDEAKDAEAKSGSPPAAEPGAAQSSPAESPKPAAVPANDVKPEPRVVETATPQGAAEASKPEPERTEPAVGGVKAAQPPEPESSERKISELEKAQPGTPEASAAQPPLSEVAASAEPPGGEKGEGEKAGGSIFSRRATLQAARQTLQPEAPPAPPKKKKKRRDGTLSVMSGFLSFLLVALVASVFGVIAVLHKLKEPGPLAADRIVYLPPRSDVPEMLAQLQREGVIDSPALMNFAVLVEGARGKLKPGEYQFRKQASLRDVIDALVAGRQLMHSLTIPEGLTSEQILDRLRDSDLLAGDILEAPKEGALLPETYKFPRGFPRSKLLVKMQDDQRKLVDQIWAKRAKDLPLRSPYELVTLASIVEKETGKAEERPRVAAVFMNRLKKGMRLQSDPTIVYGLVGGKATLGRGILRSEIEKWTPYNTYAIDGLPPGPIANPGKAALEATANPASTRDLYFVADGTGGHVFAESLDQHSRNVQNWRRIEQEQKAKAGEGIDQSAPAAVPPPAPPKGDKPDKRTQAPIGRLIALGARHEDYPASRETAPDDGATHRLGKFSPAGAAFFLGGFEDPAADLAPRPARLRVARPFFTETVAQPKGPANGFDPTLLAARPAPDDAAEEDGALGPDMLARESADGRALPDGPGDIALYPVSPARRAELKARAARLGLATGSDDAPTEAVADRTAAEAAAAPAHLADGSAPLALAPAPQRYRPRAFDASEGTPLDPLRDKSWDLTSAKTVPSAASIR